MDELAYQKNAWIKKRPGKPTVEMTREKSIEQPAANIGISKPGKSETAKETVSRRNSHANSKKSTPRVSTPSTPEELTVPSFKAETRSVNLLTTHFSTSLIEALTEKYLSAVKKKIMSQMPLILNYNRNQNLHFIDFCSVCASIGHENGRGNFLLVCKSCQNGYHPYCLPYDLGYVVKFQGKQYNFYCPDCIVCQKCHLYERAEDLLICADCGYAIHSSTCFEKTNVDDILLAKPGKEWRCNSCISCWNCGKVQADLDSLAKKMSVWRLDYKACLECYSKVSCPVCFQRYGRNQTMKSEVLVKCKICQCWLHATCLPGLNSIDDVEKLSADGVICGSCGPKNRKSIQGTLSGTVSKTQMKKEEKPNLDSKTSAAVPLLTAPPLSLSMMNLPMTQTIKIDKSQVQTQLSQENYQRFMENFNIDEATINTQQINNINLTDAGKIFFTNLERERLTKDLNRTGSLSGQKKNKNSQISDCHKAISFNFESSSSRAAKSGSFKSKYSEKDLNLIYPKLVQEQFFGLDCSASALETADNNELSCSSAAFNKIIKNDQENHDGPLVGGSGSVSSQKLPCSNRLTEMSEIMIEKSSRIVTTHDFRSRYKLKIGDRDLFEEIFKIKLPVKKTEFFQSTNVNDHTEHTRPGSSASGTFIQTQPSQICKIEMNQPQIPPQALQRPIVQHNQLTTAPSGPSPVPNSGPIIISRPVSQMGQVNYAPMQVAQVKQEMIVPSGPVQYKQSPQVVYQPPVLVKSQSLTMEPQNFWSQQQQQVKQLSQLPEKTNIKLEKQDSAGNAPILSGLSAINSPLTMKTDAEQTKPENDANSNNDLMNEFDYINNDGHEGIPNDITDDLDIIDKYCEDDDIDDIEKLLDTLSENPSNPTSKRPSYQSKASDASFNCAVNSNNSGLDPLSSFNDLLLQPFGGSDNDEIKTNLSEVNPSNPSNPLTPNPQSPLVRPNGTELNASNTNSKINQGQRDNNSYTKLGQSNSANGPGLQTFTPSQPSNISNLVQPNEIFNNNRSQHISNSTPNNKQQQLSQPPVNQVNFNVQSQNQPILSAEQQRHRFLLNSKTQAAQNITGQVNPNFNVQSLNPHGGPLIPPMVNGHNQNPANNTHNNTTGTSNHARTAARSSAKWQADEPLGENSTIAPVLYCNMKHPELITTYPDWKIREKQISKHWRKMTQDEKTPYLAKAKENRQAEVRRKKAMPASERKKFENKLSQQNQQNPQIQQKNEMSTQQAIGNASVTAPQNQVLQQAYISKATGKNGETYVKLCVINPNQISNTNNNQNKNKTTVLQMPAGPAQGQNSNLSTSTSCMTNSMSSTSHTTSGIGLTSQNSEKSGCGNAKPYSSVEQNSNDSILNEINTPGFKKLYQPTHESAPLGNFHNGVNSMTSSMTSIGSTKSPGQVTGTGVNEYSSIKRELNEDKRNLLEFLWRGLVLIQFFKSYLRSNKKTA